MASPTDNAQLYGRVCQLVVSNKTLNGLDLSQFRIKFQVKTSDTATPNTADIRVYNLEEQTAVKIRKEFTKVVLQAGYEGNYGVIFQGNIKQVIIGRESATDTFIDIVAGDGDRAYNFAIVATSLAKGSTQNDQVKAAITPMVAKGVTAGAMSDTGTNQLPRGKVMYGNSRNYLRDVAQTTGSSWSIQNEKVTFVSKSAYLPGTAVLINSDTGMIGTPQQTNEGVNVKCLLNPNLKISGRIKLDNRSVQRVKLNIDQIAAAKGDVSAINNLIPRDLNADGVYYVLVVSHAGDNRGIEWYSNLVTLSIDQTANPLNSVQTDFGGGF